MPERLNDLLAPAGLFVRGGFHPADGDSVPALPDGSRARTVVLVGNAGAAIWRAFEASADRSVRNPLDSWLKPIVEHAAAEVGAAAVFPNEGPPFPPVIDWAMRAEPVHRSPIGIMIHPEFGLWHVYRAALLFADALELPPRDTRPSPCETCAKRPCLTVCPADAFRPDRFEAAACADHVESAGGGSCRRLGCLARRACPVGAEYRYVAAQQEFHTAAMLRAVRRGFGAG